MNRNFKTIQISACLGATIAAFLVLAGCIPAAMKSLPPSSAHYGIIRTQRIRFDNAPLFNKANEAIYRRDDAAAIKYFNDILKNDPGNNQAKLRLIAIYERVKRYDDGICLCDELIRLYPNYIDTYISKGYLALKTGRFDVAAQTLQDGLQKAPPDFTRRLEMLKTLGHAYARLGKFGQAARYYSLAFALENDPGQKIDLGLFLAGLCMDQHRLNEARIWLQKIAPLAGSNIRWTMAMSRLDFVAGDYRACTERLLILNERPPGASLLLGFAFMKRGMPGPALEYLNEIHEQAKLTEDEQLNLFRNRGYLNFDQGRYTEALMDTGAAMDMSPAVDMALAHLKSLANVSSGNEPENEGEYILDDEENGLILTGAERAQVLTVMGRSLNRQKNYDTAIRHLTAAVKLDPSLAEAFYLRGLAYHSLGKSREAVTNYLEYVQMETNPPANFWGDLGQAEGKLREYGNGTAALQRSLAYFSVDVDTLSDRGYQFMKWNHNPKAKASFQRALDYYNDLVPRVPTNETAAYRNGELAMKKEYTKLDHLFGIQAYMSRSDYGFPTNVGISSIDGALPSQGGLELSFRPPLVGFRNEKILEIFGNVLGNFKHQTWSPDPDSYQGMAGVRYKPLARLNYNMSFARLMKIGDNAENNWLWRNLASWERGGKPAENKKLGLNLKIFGDIGYYLSQRSRWYGYFDGRAGPSWKISRNIFLTLPQVMGILRFETNDDPGTGSYGLTGIGFNLRIFEMERRYTVDRVYLDFFAYYTAGEFESTPRGFNSPSFNGAMFGFNLVK